MVEIEVLLAHSLGWSLFDIDQTDVDSLMDFINHLTDAKRPERRPERRQYIDQVAWI